MKIADYFNTLNVPQIISTLEDFLDHPVRGSYEWSGDAGAVDMSAVAPLLGDENALKDIITRLQRADRTLSELSPEGVDAVKDILTRQLDADALYGLANMAATHDFFRDNPDFAADERIKVASVATNFGLICDKTYRVAEDDTKQFMHAKLG